MVGGMENQNYQLHSHLSGLTETKIIANRYGKKFLPIFIPYALIKSFLILKKYDVVLLGDGVLAILGWVIRIFNKKPIICILHGLDVTFKNRFYQKIWGNVFFGKINKFIVVSRATRGEAIKRKIPSKKLIFIPNGLDFERLAKIRFTDGNQLPLKTKFKNKKVIFTLCRLVKRKGVGWFVNEVMPKLAKDILYIIAGEGPEKNQIKNIIKKNKLDKNVIMLGWVSEETKKMLFYRSNAFVQPNIKVAGDMEGFCITALEAAYCGLPVIASKLEGITDAIKDGKNGFLVNSEDAEYFKRKIEELLADNWKKELFCSRSSEFVARNYNWKKITKKYLHEIKETLNE